MEEFFNYGSLEDRRIFRESLEAPCWWCYINVGGIASWCGTCMEQLLHHYAIPSLVTTPPAR